MRSQAVDLVLALPMGAPRHAKGEIAAQLTAWLRTTQVALRSIGFEAGCLFDDTNIIKHRRTWQRLVTSSHALAGSQDTLEVLPF